MTWIATYVVFCIIIAVLGRGRRPGVAGWFLISMILTPLVGLAIFLVTQTTLVPAPRPPRRIALSPPIAAAQLERCARCHRKLKRVEVAIDVCSRCGAEHT